MKSIVLFILLATVGIFPQEKDEHYYISMDVAGGYSRYFTSMSFEDLNKNGYDAMVRVLWHPEHLLSIGIETGYQRHYSIDKIIDPADFDAANLSIRLEAIPISAIFSMKIFPKTLPGLRLNGGSGVSYIFSTGNLYNDKFSSAQVIINYIVSINYLHQLNNRLSAGSEIKFTHLSKLEDSAVSLSLLISYKFISW